MRRAAAILNAICALLALAVVAVTAAFLLIDPNDYKARIVDAVQDATGRTLTLGELTLTRSLWPTLQARDVALSNLPGGSRPDMAHAERIEGQLSLLALLRHEIDITRLTLIGPNILFEPVGGQPNWVFTPAASTASPAAEPGRPYALRVERAHIRNGMVTWKLPARTKVVGIRALDFTRKREGGPVEMRSTLVYSDNQPFALDLAATPTGALMDAWRTTLRFAAFDTSATAIGSMSVAGDYDLQLEATSGAVEKLNALLPEMALPPLHGAALSAHLAHGEHPGDVPVIGPASLRFDSAELKALAPGLTLGATTLTLPAPGGAAAIETAGRYAGLDWRGRGSVGIPLHPDQATSLPLTLSASMGGVDAALKGNVALRKLAFAGLDGMATAKAATLAGLRPAFGDSVPALTELRFAGQLSAPASGAPLRLRGASLETAQGDLAGDGAIDPAAASLSGDWHAKSLDLDATLAAFGVSLQPGGGAAGPVIPATAVDWAALRRAALDLRLGVDSMAFAGETWRDVRAAVTLAGGRLQAGPVSVAMPGSRLQASLLADAGTGSASITLSAPALPLALMARLAGLPGPVSGTAALDVRWQAQGRTMRALAGSLAGPFSLLSTGGTLPNQTLLALTAAALGSLGIAVPAEGQTRLDCLGLAGSFAAGVATVRTVALQTTYLSLAGTGTVDLPREHVDFQLQPLAQVAGSPVSVPVVVSGPFRAVTGRLDATGLQQLGFLLNGLFGGDRAQICERAGLAR